MLKRHLYMKPSEIITEAASSDAREFTRPEELACFLAVEFRRLNETYFAGILVTPVIDVSVRKTYGGYYQPVSHRIVVSWQAYREHGLQESLNTFRHEVAHIRHLNHSQAFWSLAKQLGAAKKYAASPVASRLRPQRYTYQCPACGIQIHRSKRIRRSSCAKCDGKFNPEFQFILVTG